MSEYYSLLSPIASVDDDEVRRLARHGCLDIHRVLWPRCYLAADGLRMLCHYQANDAEAVRYVLRQQGFLESTVFQADCVSRESGLGGSEQCTVVEFKPPLEDIGQLVSTAHSVFSDNSVSLRSTIQSPKGDVLIFILQAANPDSLRAQLESAGIRATAIWSCKALDPRPTALFTEVANQAGATSADTTALERSNAPPPDVDVVIIGAGVSGISALHRFVSMGLQVRVFDRASDVGGVWHWNRYPGARVDSETYSYALSFSEESADDWDWSELFCAQPEIERYLLQVVQRFDLRRHITLNTAVASAEYIASRACWCIHTDAGEAVSARYLIVASGTLSTPQLPGYPGMDAFTGPASHTALWPAEGIPLAGKRVAVIGTGASGVQVIQTIAEEVGHLTVFQRTPTYCVPQRNRPLSDNDRQDIRQRWHSILASCRNSYGGFIHDFDERSGLAVPRAEREQLFEELWQQPGFAFWLGNFADLMMNAQVNEYACDFVRRKIRQRVADPAVARKLMPDHPFGSKRVPLENGYYEAYNRPNVELVDLRETPITTMTPEGISTSNKTYPLDVIIYATGFDVGTGAFNRMDIRGEEGLGIAEKWNKGPRTFLGLMISGFPNLFIANGPQNPSGLCNATRCIEQNVEWIAAAIQHLQQQGLTTIVPTGDAEQRWVDHVNDAAAGSVLAANTHSWFYGANTPDKAQQVNIYAPGAQHFREHCEEVERLGYAGCILS